MSTNKQVNPYFYSDFELLWCSENYNMAHMLSVYSELKF